MADEILNAMDKLRLRCKLAWKNFNYILSRSDLLPVRLILSLASIVWAIWGIGIIIVDLKYIMPEIDRTVMFAMIPLWLWIVAFLMHGIFSLIMVLLKIQIKPLLMVISCFGALLWSFNVDLMLVTHIEKGVFPLITSQWTLAGISWWVFIRNCYGN